MHQNSPVVAYSLPAREARQKQKQEEGIVPLHGGMHRRVVLRRNTAR